MTIFQTKDLTGAALDWAVATANGLPTVVHGIGEYRFDVRGGIHCSRDGCTYGARSFSEDVQEYSPSTMWKDGGPIIESEIISVVREDCSDFWMATREIEMGPCEKFCNPSFGPTPLIAAMRCYVAANLGTSVDVPEELA